MMGNAAKHKYYVNSDDYTYDAYDEKIFPSLDKILKGETTKKMIFIHLIGTHGAYKRRYPKSKDYFSTENPLTKFKHSQSLEKINHYDNAVRYNDSIVRTIIEKVKKQNTNSYVLYFSDHGDEVYDTVDFSGHSEGIGSKPMYDVPFVVWLSKKYKQNKHPFLATNDLLNRSYNLEDFIHGFSDLSNISFDQIDLSKSIFNSEYIKTKRMIKNGVDYDKE
jgi:heptose-I-phosphate ethanolaminephosphotransferase